MHQCYKTRTSEWTSWAFDFYSLMSFNVWIKILFFKFLYILILSNLGHSRMESDGITLFLSLLAGLTSTWPNLADAFNILDLIWNLTPIFDLINWTDSFGPNTQNSDKDPSSCTNTNSRQINCMKWVYISPNWLLTIYNINIYIYIYFTRKLSTW